MHPEYNEAPGDSHPSHDGPGSSYGSFRGEAAAEEFHQTSRRATAAQVTMGSVDGRLGLSTAFSQALDNSIRGGFSLPSEYAANGGFHQIPSTMQQSQNDFSGNCPSGFHQSPARYSGGDNTYKEGNHGANVMGDYYWHRSRHDLDPYRSEMPTGSGISSQHSNENLRGSSAGFNKQAQHDPAHQIEHHQRDNRFQRENPGLFGGSELSGIDNHKGNFQYLLQASDSSLGHHGSTGKLFSGNEVGRFVLNSSRADEENMIMYNGTIDEFDSLCKEGKVKDAVKVLSMLQQRGIVVDLTRYFFLFQLCGENKCLEEARIVHDHVLRSLENVEVKVYNKMLDMYCKCGSVDDAQRLFETMPERNLASWDIMIMGLSTNGLGEDAIILFTEFKQKGLNPDGVMFLTVFHVCGTLGAVDEGFLHFESMRKEFGIQPTMEHYCGIVSMLGAAGYLYEAMEFIDSIPGEPTADVWEALMNLCRVHGNVELGDLCAEIIENLDPSKLTEDSRKGLLPVKDSDQMMKDKKKSDLAARGRVHEYRAGDRSHPESDKIYALLRGLAIHMREIGYIPETRFVLHDVDPESKEEALLQHSEKLALSYGLMTTPARSPIRIIKNLRSCVDCHNYMKIISKLVGRQLIIRDAKRFHHFENGLCSCRDYW